MHTKFLKGIVFHNGSKWVIWLLMIFASTCKNGKAEETDHDR